MRAAVYARVSTERQGRDQTIESQLDALRGWAAGHGYELKGEHIYIDEGYSGSRLDRPALDRCRPLEFAIREAMRYYPAVPIYFRNSPSMVSARKRKLPEFQR